MIYPFVLAVGLMLSLGAGTSHAQTQAEQNACHRDAQRLCQNAIPDRERVYQCLSRNRRHLSQLCRAAMSRGRGR